MHRHGKVVVPDVDDCRHRSHPGAASEVYRREEGGRTRRLVIVVVVGDGVM
jgi:hypothetical protein